MTTIVYHNPHCSKSRATLALLAEHGIDFTVIEYLKNPPDALTLLDLANKLNQPLLALLRTHKVDQNYSKLPDKELAEKMSEQPILIQRPIVVAGEQARIGRPPEQVLELFR